jgi:hypothetical protein
MLWKKWEGKQYIMGQRAVKMLNVCWYHGLGYLRIRIAIMNI